MARWQCLLGVRWKQGQNRGGGSSNHKETHIYRKEMQTEGLVPLCVAVVYLCGCVASLFWNGRRLRGSQVASRYVSVCVSHVVSFASLCCLRLYPCWPLSTWFPSFRGCSASLCVSLCSAWFCFASLRSCVTFQQEMLGSGTGARRPQGPLGLSPVGLFSSPFMETSGLNQWESS